MASLMETPVPEAAEVQGPPEAISYASTAEGRVRPPILVALLGYVFSLVLIGVGTLLALSALGDVLLNGDASGGVAIALGLGFVALGVYLVVHIAKAQAGQGNVTSEEAAQYGSPEALDGAARPGATGRTQPDQCPNRSKI